MSRLGDPTARSSLIIDSGDSYVDYQTRMVSSAKEIARVAQEMVYLLKIFLFNVLVFIFPMFILLLIFYFR